MPAPTAVLFEASQQHSAFLPAATLPSLLVRQARKGTGRGKLTQAQAGARALASCVYLVNTQFP